MMPEDDCPLCDNGTLILSKSGLHEPFSGCSSYPKCRGIPLPDVESDHI